MLNSSRPVLFGGGRLQVGLVQQLLQARLASHLAGCGPTAVGVEVAALVGMLIQASSSRLAGPVSKPVTGLSRARGW